MSASTGNIPFFTLAWGVVWYKRINVFSISSVVVPSPFEQSMFKGIHKTFCLTIKLWVVGWWWTCVMQHELQKYWNISDVNWDLLSETDVSSSPCWLNSHLKMAIIKWVSAFCNGKFSGFFGMGIDHYQKYMAIDRASKVNMYPGPWLL